MSAGGISLGRLRFCCHGLRRSLTGQENALFVVQFPRIVEQEAIAHVEAPVDTVQLVSNPVSHPTSEQVPVPRSLVIISNKIVTVHRLECDSSGWSRLHLASSLTSKPRYHGRKAHLCAIGTVQRLPCRLLNSNSSIVPRTSLSALLDRPDASRNPCRAGRKDARCQTPES